MYDDGKGGIDDRIGNGRYIICCCGCCIIASDCVCCVGGINIIVDDGIAGVPIGFGDAYSKLEADEKLASLLTALG